jgi:hemoglobin-like flavoprotein
MLPDQALIEDSLERAAQRLEDLSPMVYQRFFLSHPEAEALFGPDDANLIKGNMLNGILHAVMAQAEGQELDRAYYWAMDHVSYGVSLPMFQVMFEAIVGVLGDCLQSEWTDAMASAWQRQFEELMVQIRAAFVAGTA